MGTFADTFDNTNNESPVSKYLRLLEQQNEFDDWFLHCFKIKWTSPPNDPNDPNGKQKW